MYKNLCRVFAMFMNILRHPYNIRIHICVPICGRRYVHGCVGLNKLHYHIFNKIWCRLSLTDMIGGFIKKIHVMNFSYKLTWKACVMNLNIIEIHIFTEVEAKLLYMNTKFDYCTQIIAAGDLILSWLLVSSPFWCVRNKPKISESSSLCQTGVSAPGFLQTHLFDRVNLLQEPCRISSTKPAPLRRLMWNLWK